MDQHSPAIDQATLARFITEGFFLSHVNGSANSMPSDAYSLSNNSKNGWATISFWK
jgi:Transcriptional regulators containing a DNA-binding HTH domain and an aminotransferase domain (MocR family) and their eukaryotic orthologs